MARTPDERIEAQARAIRGMRQYRDKIASGEMTDDDVLRLAAARVLSQPKPDLRQSGREFFGTYGRAGAPLFEEPWFVGRTHEADEILSTPHPDPVLYNVYAERRNGTITMLIIDLSPTPL